MSSGKNYNTTLKARYGARVIGGYLCVAISRLWFHPEGHPLRHPRAADPVDEALRDDIAERGVEEEITVREEEQPDARLPGESADQREAREGNVLAVGDGACRTNAGNAAEKIMRKKDSPILIDGELWVRIKLFRGNDAEFLLMRQSRDANRFKRPHDVFVLAQSIVQLHNCQVSDDRILKEIPRAWTKAAVEAVVNHWHKVADKPFAQRFKVVDDRYVAALPIVLAAKTNERDGLLTRLLASGRSTTITMQRWLSQEAAAEITGDGAIDLLKDTGEATSDAPDIEEDGLGNGEEGDQREGADESDADSEGAEEGSDEPERAPSKARSTEPAAPKTAPVKQAKSAKFVRKLYDVANKKGTSHDILFFTGALATMKVGDPDQAKKNLAAIMKLIKDDSVAAAVKEVFAGILWARGTFGTSVEGCCKASTLAIIESRGDNAPKASGKKHSKKEVE